MKKFFLLFLLITFNCISQDSNKNIISESIQATLKNEKLKNPTDLKEIIKMEEEFEAKPSTLPEKEKKEQCKIIHLNFENEDLTDVINQIAGLKCINIIFPQPPSKFNVKFNFTTSEEVTIDKAWNLIQTVIDLAGFSIVKKGSVYHIVPTSSSNKEPVIRETLPIYVDVVEQIPNTDEKIRFIYFFDNISLQARGNNKNLENLEQILKDMLINEPEPSYVFDQSSNSVIISAKASVIKGIMRIIEELDKTGFREAIEVIPILHTKASFITEILSKLMPAETEQYRFGYPRLPRVGAQYFSEATKVVPIERTNSVAILGSQESVTKVRDFITKNLDVAIETGKSIIHVKRVEYLNAKELAPVIQALVKEKTDQSESEIKDGLANAIIVAEEQVTAPALTPTAAPGTREPSSNAPTTGAIMGSNNLIVAARSSDYHFIRDLIDSIDKPQMQIGLDVLITEIRIDDEKALAAQTRNITNPDNNNLKFQTANLGQAAAAAGQVGSVPWLNFISTGANTFAINNATGIAADLGQPYLTRDSNGNVLKSYLAALPPPGETLFTFKDGNGVSHMLRILDRNIFTGTILAHPYVVTKNNKQANVAVNSSHFVPGAVNAASTGGPVTINNTFINAALSINILPRVTAKADTAKGEVNLEISVTSNNFANVVSSLQARFTRKINTNANVNNNEVLVIGGLVRTDVVDTQFETPPLSKIPIIGWLFKGRDRTILRTMLMIFIKPTIIKPRLEGALSDYSKDKIDFMKADLRDSEEAIVGKNFENLKDPITRFFFAPMTESRDKAFDYYAQQAVYSLDAAQQDLPVKPIEPKKNEPKILKKQTKNLKEIIKDEKNPLITH